MKDYGDVDEADKSIMMAIIDGMVQGTRFQGLFATEWCWRRAWRSYSETLVFTAMFDHEDRRAEWLTFKNTNQWIYGAKQILLDIMVVKDWPCMFPGK